MAFHGSRGTSRNNNRGSSRGSGHRGVVTRGRGRGRGGSKGNNRGNPIFDSSRIADQGSLIENNQSELANSEDGSEQLSTQESNSEEEDESPVSSERPYATLMKSFTAKSSVHAVKRRKLNRNQEPKSNQVDKDGTLTVVDEVEEPEEGPETATEGLLEEDNDELIDVSDPFEAHFADPDDNVLAERLKTVNKQQWSTRKVFFPEVGNALVSIPAEHDTLLHPSLDGPSQLRLKSRLATLTTKIRPSFDALERTLAPFVFGYQDVLYCERTVHTAESLQRLVCLHAVNHIFKTRDRVIKNNARLAKDESDSQLEFRDQGFTRPKVLMLLPTRESCSRMVKMIVSLCGPDQEENRKRFDESYITAEEKFSADKAEDFRDLFGGNDDDMFRIGLKFTRKSIKYFSQFYNSDIIFASPLGLRMALEGKDEKKGDFDFLSSIEILIVDQADALLMQNWEHVEHIFDHVNLQPKEAHGCDFSRVRNWYLNNTAKYFRQTIALASFNTPELNTLFYGVSKNWAGKTRINAIYTGALQELGLKIKQTFSRFESFSHIEEPDARFTYFTAAIVPTLTRNSKESSGTIIFVPSYLDFVRVRNYFITSPATSGLSFGSISEYTSVQDVARARSHFLSGRYSILLYTERAHHFRRYQIRGVRKVIMYGVPENPIFYKEIIGDYFRRSVQEGRLEVGKGSVRAIFSKWDALKLERIVGTERVGRMINDKGDTFDFL